MPTQPEREVPANGPGAGQRGGQVRILAALFIAALALRPNLVGVGPLLPQIIDELGTTHAVTGLLATIPVICMGLVAPFATRLARSVGARRGVVIALAFLTAFGIMRAAAGDAVSLVAVTVPIGLAIGIGGALLPVVVKERLPFAASVATGVYTTAIQLGASISAFVAVPLALALGGWRGALAAFSLVALAALGAWLVTTSGSGAARASSSQDGAVTGESWSAWRDPLVWLLAILYWLCAFPFYGLITWLSAALVEQGWDATTAGALVATVSLAGLPGSLLIGWTADRLGSRRRTMVAWAALMTAGVAGFAVAPGLAPVWALVTGLSIGATFTLTLILPLDIAIGPRNAPAVIGVVLMGGYLLTSATPVIVGAMRDLTGSFDASLWLLVAVSALVIPFSAPLTRARLGGR